MKQFKIGKYTTYFNCINALNEKSIIAVWADVITKNGHKLHVPIIDINFNSLIRLLKNPFGYCSYCERYFVWPKRFHKNTAYVEVERNYSCMCKDCQEEDDAYYQELWDDYNRSRY